MTPPIELRIPDPCLVVLVGAAGAGKSTFAARHFAPGEVLSADAFRERIAGDAGDQRATAPAFAALHRTLEARLAGGLLTVVDATNVTAAARRALIGLASAAGMPAVAVILDPPAAAVLSRNASRPARVVPEAVVRRHLRELSGSLRDGRLEGEGFAAVLRLGDPGATDAVRVVRVGR